MGSCPSPTMSGTSTRPPSIRSVASNSSIASSLSRRPRTRARSRTFTGGSSRAEDIASTPVEELPVVNGVLVQEPRTLSPVDASSSSSGLARPPQRLDTHSSATVSSLSLEPTTAEVTAVEALPVQDDSKMPKPSELVTARSYKPPPSAFSPAFTPNIRDSVSTDQSGFSSSLYPASTITDSPPTPTFTQPLEYLNAPVQPTVKEVQNYDGDDVAYRLQLLVKNNYFLPPAHSKPSAADFAALNPSQTTKKPPKSSTPAFLDLFRAVKPKSKPPTPTNSPNPDAPLPVLRTTAESITTAHLLRPQPAQGSAPPPSPRPSPQQPSRGRVVVVREKMDDLLAAAKQAEQDLKARGVEIPPRPPVIIADDVIDPTDAVDLPPPLPGYPFAVQASALHGLGVQDSLGAALLADRLVPHKSSNTSSFLDADEGWRKALLHQAVHHSLDNTPDVSMFSTPIGASTPVLSPRRRSKSQAPSPTSSRELLKSNLVEPAYATQSPVPRRSPRSADDHSHQRPPSLELSRDSRFSSVLPARVETPLGALTPLGPPPRQYRGKPSPNSQTTAEQIPDPRRSHSSLSHHSLRKSRSSPSIAEPDPNERGFVMTPPPLPSPSIRIPSQGTVQSYDTLGRMRAQGTFTAASFYSDDDYEDPSRPRDSFATSVVSHGRPSISDYSQSSLSPTTSAFQDALNRGPYTSGPSSFHGSFSNLHPSREPSPRVSTTSPPPRLSSTIAHTALAPPPRRSTHPYAHPYNQTPSASSSVRLEDTFELTEPEPASPPIPSVGRQRDSIISTLSLDAASLASSSPRANVRPSQPSFFDSIQSHPNAMDDLESSSDESDVEVPQPLHSRSRVDVSESRGRSASVPDKNPLTRYGNYSAPYISKPGNNSDDRLLPVGNIAPKPQFFSERKSDSGHAMPSVAYNLIRNAHEEPNGQQAEASPRPSTAASAKTAPPAHSSWRSEDRKLDGMVKQHLETEKDTIKRIATTIKQSGPLPKPRFPS
ncbi:hypothetical protein BKA70DRAFT_1148933 [Coprinopsis sp. MPI-PUGE-AT-0042]|nr:hypothetical protein BKA70DRAFT_1148933 [Coprinopsis sp. MPI-PUGE-AT-0042]